MAKFDELSLTGAEMEDFDLMCSSMLTKNDVKKELTTHLTDRFASVDHEKINSVYEANHSASTKISRYAPVHNN